MIHEDEAGWDCHTMGNLDCGAAHYTSGDHAAGVGHAYGLPDTSIPAPGMSLDGLVVVGALLLAAAFGRWVDKRR